MERRVPLPSKFFLVSLIVLGCRAQPEEVREDNAHISRERGVVYYDGEPYNGKLVDTYPDGAVQQEFSLQEGIRSGISRFYWPDGTLKKEAEYKNGVYNGYVKVYYENGAIYSWFNYVDGHESGRQQVWKSDGRLKANYEVINGRKYGLTGVKNCINVLEEDGHIF